MIVAAASLSKYGPERKPAGFPSPDSIWFILPCLGPKYLSVKIVTALIGWFSYRVARPYLSGESRATALEKMKGELDVRTCCIDSEGFMGEGQGEERRLELVGGLIHSRERERER